MTTRRPCSAASTSTDTCRSSTTPGCSPPSPRSRSPTGWRSTRAATSASARAALGAGILGGAFAGGLHHKSLGLSDDDKACLEGELASGKAAVGVLADVQNAPAIGEFLIEFGGAPQTHELSDEAIAAASA